MTPEYVELRAQRLRDLGEKLTAILPRAGAFTWEVGCGHGHFLTAYAAAHPQKCCIGIDIVSERIERAERKRHRAGHENLHFVLAEARLFLEALPAAASIDATFILFPDPWPKLRHHKHRILQPAFLASLSSRMGQGGRLYFRTDHTPYFESARAALEQHPDWKMVDETWPFEYETIFQQRAASFHSLIAQPGPSR